MTGYEVGKLAAKVTGWLLLVLFGAVALVVIGGCA